MANNDPILDIIKYYFSNDELLLANAIKHHHFDDEKLSNSLNNIICYYLATRDEDIYKSLDIVNKKYEKIAEHTCDDFYYENIFKKGYVTHAFPGSEKRLIEQYGFDFYNKLNNQDKLYYEEIKKGLAYMEQYKKCLFVHMREIREKRTKELDGDFYFTIPGKKTIFYANMTPERFYRGPVHDNEYSPFPIVVGEAKSLYYERIFKFIMNRTRYLEWRDPIYLPDNPELVKRTIEHYCYKPTLAFVSFQNIYDIPIYSSHITKNSVDQSSKLFYFISDSLDNAKIQECFTQYDSDKPEPSNIGDFVTQSSNISLNETTFIDYPDFYDLKQKYYQKRHYREGTIVDKEHSKKLKKLSEPYKSLYKKSL